MNFQQFVNIFPIIIFHLVSYLALMNLWWSGSTRNKNISVRRLRGQCFSLPLHKDRDGSQFFAHCRELNLLVYLIHLYINMIASNNWVMVNECFIIPAHVPNQCTCYNVISRTLSHACTYPVATQKGVADLCLYQLQCMCKCMCIVVLKIFSLCS